MSSELMQEEPIKTKSFFAILARELEAKPGVPVIVKLTAIPLSYQGNLANLKDKFKRRKGWEVSYHKVNSFVIFTLNNL